MSPETTQFWLIVVNAFLLAGNIFLALITGSAFNWAASVFIGVMLLFQIALISR